MKIETGKHYRTRDGKKVLILANDTTGSYSIVGVAYSGSKKTALSWTGDGMYFVGCGLSPNDIVSEWIETPVHPWHLYPKWAALLRRRCNCFFSQADY